MTGMTEWIIAPGLTDYDDAVAFMETRAAAIHAGHADELIWLVEHPPLYTAGTSARADDLLDPRFPVHATGRGGQYTYHGPGQRVIYVMLDLNRRGKDVRAFVHGLEDWIIGGHKTASGQALMPGTGWIELAAEAALEGRQIQPILL